MEVVRIVSEFKKRMMIVPTKNPRTMPDKKHICSTALPQTGTKRLRKCRKRALDKFTCGRCNSSFHTICSLHDHCTKHSVDGSYFFDNLTYTAFPKFESVCAFTQVDGEILDFELLHDGNASEAFTPSDIHNSVKDSSKLVTKRVTPARRSKSQAKVNKIWVTSKKNQSCHSIIDSKDEAQQTLPKAKSEETVNSCSSTKKGVISVTKNAQCDLNELNGRTSHDLPITNNKSETQVSTDLLTPECIDHSADLKDEGLSTGIHSGVTSIPQANQCRRRNNILKCDKNSELITENGEDVHEKDKMTASEVLIAISKGVSAEESEEMEETFIDDKKLKVESPDKTRTTINNVKVVQTDNQSSEKQETPDLERNTSVEEEYHKGTGSRERKRKGEKGLLRGELKKCPVCGKVGGQALMHYHKYMHMEKRDLTCETCGASFKHPRCLQTHQKQHMEKQYRCSLCTAAFHRKDYLKTHMLKHTGEEPYMCDICGKSYREKNNLSRHIRHVHEKVRKYECNICNDRFFRSDHLQNHMLRHTEPSKKCDYCPRMFKHPDDLLRHTKTHTGEKKWHCHLCGHGFVAVTPYYVHMLKKHGINREESQRLKNKLQAEHKLRMAGKSVSNSNDVACQLSMNTTKPISMGPLGTETLPIFTQSGIPEGTQTDNTGTPVSLHMLTQQQSNMSEQMIVTVEPVSNTQTVPHDTEYVLEFGDQDLSENQTVVLEDGTTLDHFKIDNMGEAFQLRNVGATSEHGPLNTIEAVQIRSMPGGCEGMEMDSIEFEEGGVQTVMYVDACGEQIAEEVIIQNQ